MHKIKVNITLNSSKKKRQSKSAIPCYTSHCIIGPTRKLYYRCISHTVFFVLLYTTMTAVSKGIAMHYNEIKCDIFCLRWSCLPLTGHTAGKGLSRGQLQCMQKVSNLICIITLTVSEMIQIGRYFICLSLISQLNVAVNSVLPKFKQKMQSATTIPTSVIINGKHRVKHIVVG